MSGLIVCACVELEPAYLKGNVLLNTAGIQREDEFMLPSLPAYTKSAGLSSQDTSSRCSGKAGKSPSPNGGNLPKAVVMSGPESQQKALKTSFTCP